MLMVVFFLLKKKKNRLCVIGLAPAHVAFKDKGGITAVDFNVGKSDRSVIKVTGKRKKVLMCVCDCVCRRMYLKKLLYCCSCDYHLNSALGFESFNDMKGKFQFFIPSF